VKYLIISKKYIFRDFTDGISIFTSKFKLWLPILDAGELLEFYKT